MTDFNLKEENAELIFDLQRFFADKKLLLKRLTKMYKVRTYMRQLTPVPSLNSFN